MGKIFTANSDFEKLWGEPIPEIEFEEDEYTLEVTEGNFASVSFFVEATINNKNVDVTSDCVFTFDNDYVSVQYEGGEYYFVTSDKLAAGEYTTVATATYNYKSATVTATTTINIAVESSGTTAR